MKNLPAGFIQRTTRFLRLLKRPTDGSDVDVQEHAAGEGARNDAFASAQRSGRRGRGPAGPPLPDELRLSDTYTHAPSCPVRNASYQQHFPPLASPGCSSSCDGASPACTCSDVPGYPIKGSPGGSKGDLSLFRSYEDQLQKGPITGVARGGVDFLNSLPYEISTYILNFADVRTLGRVARTCRGWNTVAKDNELWKDMFRRRTDWKIRLPLPDKPLDVLSEPPYRRHKPLPMYRVPESYRKGSSVSLLSLENRRPNAVSSFGVDGPPIESTLQFFSSLDWRELYRQRHTLERRWKCGQVTTRYLHGHTDSVYCIQFDDRKIVTGSRDRTIKFWDIRTGQCYYTLTGHDASVLCLHYDEELLVTGSSDTTLIMWDMKTCKQINRLRAHSMGVLDVCADGKYIVSCSKDSSIIVWDRRTGELLRTLLGHRGPVNAVQVHGGLVASASGDALVKLWNVHTGECVRDFVGHERGLACVRFDGELVVSGSNDRMIKIWDAETGQCIRTLEGHTDLVRSLHFNSSKIVSGSYDLTVRVWDTRTGKCLLDLRNGHSSWVFDVEFDLTKIISTSQDQKILVWDFATPDMNTELFVS